MMTKRDELRARLEKKKQRTYKTVTHGGDDYLIRTLTMRERGENEVIPIDIKKGQADFSKLSQQKCDLLCRCWVDDETKEPVIDPSEWEFWQDVDAGVAMPLLRDVEELNGTLAAGVVEKNSEPTGD